MMVQFMVLLLLKIGLERKIEAFLFDGEDDHISVPNTESLQIEEDITLSAWIKSEANLNYYTEFVLHTQNSYTLILD